MQTRAELRPVARGGVIGLGLGKFVFVGGGVLLMLASNCLAGPENARVAAGKASIRQRGNTTVIRASDRAIIDYTGFDIARHETVRFIQPGAHASVLNRIHSTRPTTIDGTLKANGHVYLLNPNGIMFSGSSVVDTGGLTAAAATMSNRDFLSGNARFSDVRGEVVNQGSILSTGNVSLIGRHVANSGVIDVAGDEGVMAMIAGDEVTLTPRGDTMSIKVANNPAAPAPAAARAGVENTGRINAGRGNAVLLSGDVYSLAVKNTGTVRARNISVDGGGRGRVEVSGNLDASSRAVGGRGGTVSITGADVALTGAMIDARGAVRGGEIRVNDTGSGPTAGRSTRIDRDSTLTADATRRGDGGTVLVNSGGNTDFHGRASARGGSVSGDGGFIETSGRESINIDGSTVDAGAAFGGLAGSWLIDPTDFTVNAGNVGAITGALDMGMDVTIETGSGGADAGNVTVDAAITKGAGGNASLTLRAENDVTVNQPITSASGELAVTVQANTAGNGNTDANPDAGSFNLNNDGGANLGAISTNGGAVSISAADVNLTGAGATIAADGGLTLTANGATDQSLGLGGGPGAFTLTDAEMQQILSNGPVAVGQDSRTDAVNIGTLSLGATGYDLTVSGGATTVTNLTLGNGDLTLISAAGALMDVGSIAAGGSVRLVAGDLALNTVNPGPAVTAGAGGIRIEPAAASDAVGVGTGAAGDLRLSTPEMHELSSAGGVTLGRADGTGQVTIGSGTAVDLGMAGYDLTLRGGPIVFANTLTLGADRQLALIGGAISNTNGLATPDYVVSGDGKLLIDSSDAVNMQTAGLRQLAARTTGNSTDIALTNFGAGEIEVTALGGMGGVSGVSAGTDGNISLVSGGPWRVSQGVSTSGTGSVTIQSENVAGDLVDNTGAMGTAVTVGPAGGITLITAAGAIRGAMAGEAFTVNTGAAAGNASATLVADASTGINIANEGAGGLVATLTTITGEAALSTGGSLTTGAVDWSADSFDVSSDGDLAVNRQITADAGDIALSSAGGLVNLAADVEASDGNIAIAASDLTIASGVAVSALGASGGDVTISRSTDGGINVGGGSFGSVTGISDYLTVDNDELNRITADALTIGDAVHTMFLRVQNVQDPDAGAGAPTADRAHQSIERLVLLAEGANSAIRFAGDQNSFFKAVEARAGAGIEVARDLTATVGGLTLDADADMADGTPGAFFTPDHDVLTFTGSRLLTTVGAPADAPDITLRGRRAAGEVGIAGDTGLTLNSTRDVTIDQSIEVAQTLTIDADREARINGGGDVRQLAVTAANGATLGGDLDVGVGGAVIDADSDDDDAGTFTVAPGTVTLADDASLRVVAADVQIDGSIAGSDTSDVRIGRSNEGNIQVGAFTDSDASNDLLTIDNAELGRITARNLTIGNYSAQGAGDADNELTNNIAVDGVTAAASDNISGLVTLRAGEDLTFSGGASTFNALTGEAAGEITVSSNLVTDAADGGDLTLTADSDNDETGSLTISGDVFTRGGNFTGSGGDFALTGRITTAENSAQGPARGDVLIFSTRDTINVNNAGADDAGRMTITDAELRNITARNLTIGGNDSTTVNVRDISADDGLGINGTTGFISGDTVNMNGTSTFGALDVQARAAVNVNGNLTTTVGDLSINANTNSDDVGQISINGARTLTSAGDLTLSTRNSGSGGVAEGVEAGGVLTLRAADDVQVNSSLTATDGSVTIAADTDADGDGTFGMLNTGSLEVQIGDLRITAADINLPAATSGNGQIRVESGDITIDRSTQGRIVLGGTGSVDDAMTIESAELRKIQGGTALTIGGTNTSRLDVRALSGADTPRVSGLVNLRALADGGADNPGVIKFNEAAHSFVALDARARSLVKVDNGGSVSTTVGGINFDTTLGAGRIELGGSLSATSGSTSADVNLRDRVLLTRNATLSARRDVHLFSTVDSAQQGGERSLTVNAGRRTIIDADLGRAKRLSGFATAAPSSSSDTGRVTRLGGDIYTNDGTGIRLRNAVQLTDDVTLQDDGEQGVFFYSTVNGTTAGAESLTVITDLSQTGTVDNTGRVTDASIPVIVFGGNVGQTTALQSLNLNTGTRLRGNNTTQSVDGHTGIPLVSTIVARRLTTGGASDGQFVSTLSSADSFAFTTTEGFTMGQNEKLSAAGTVTINAGAARLGDVTAFSGIRVNAGSIAIRSRNAGSIAVNGRRNNVAVLLTAPDLGVDFVANDFIDFNRAPTVEGGGPAPMFGTASGQRSNNNLNNFLFRQFTQSGSRIDATTFQTGTGSSLVNLDLTSTGPTDTNFAQSIAGLIPRESRFSDVGEDTTLSQALFTDLTQLGVNPRNLGGDERLANLVGWSTFDDMPEALSSDEPALFTTVNRLPDQMTREVVRQYRELVTRSVTDPQTGEVTDQSHKAAIKRTFDDAVRRYRSARNQPTGEIEPVSFREYVNRTPVESDARAYADQLADLLRNLELLGLVGRELTLAKQQILRDLRPSGIQTLRNMEIFVRTQTDLPEPDIADGVVVND